MVEEIYIIFERFIEDDDDGIRGYTPDKDLAIKLCDENWEYYYKPVGRVTEFMDRMMIEQER